MDQDLVNRRLILAQRPSGFVQPDDFALDISEVPEPEPGQALVKVRYISLDPAMRSWLGPRPNYIEPVQIGDVMRATGTAEVIASKTPLLGRGQLVTGRMGWQSYTTVGVDDIIKVETEMAPETHWLSVLGIPGLTAYFGINDIGQPKPKETVLISSAAGAVGSVAGQIAKQKGCYVVGIAGGPEKCRIVTEQLGFDRCLDYKDSEFASDLKLACPDGVDVYFDNVGGDILEIALSRINMRARIVICGAISTYNATERLPGPSNYMNLLVKSARMEGFLIWNYRRAFDEARMQLAGWLQAGAIKPVEHVVHGLDHAVEALNMLYSGANTGKLMLRL